MEQSLAILGRQPKLGLAELESLYGTLRPVGEHAATLERASDTINFDRLGGTVKLGSVIAVLDTTQWRDVEQQLSRLTLAAITELPEGKVQLGLSSYGFGVTAQQMVATGLTVKKAIKKTGRSIRLTPNKEAALNTAQVMHNHLTGSTGYEVLIVKDDTKTIIARTTNSQDIDSYTLRDRGRPKRDARVGMLPPKLAQIIINLAVGPAQTDVTVLDPFCGTGVIPQETHLMGYAPYGTDLEPRMIDYTNANLRWIDEVTQKHVRGATEIADATLHTWQEVPFTAIACETYLGRPFTSLPDPQTLSQTISDCNLIIKKFLQNVARQTQSGFRLCVAVPAWQIKPSQFKHLPLIDQIEQMDYNRVSFEHVQPSDLLYYREDQIVARELLVLRRK